MNFVLGHMYHLKYFMPLIIEGNKRGVKSNIFTFLADKDFERGSKSYAHPYRYIDYLKGKYGEIYGI